MREYRFIYTSEHLFETLNRRKALVWLGFAMALAHKECSRCRSVMPAPEESGHVKVMSEEAGAESPRASHGSNTLITSSLAALYSEDVIRAEHHAKFVLISLPLNNISRWVLLSSFYR